MTTPRPSTDTLPAEVDIAIVGSGFSGLGMAIRLKRDGVEDFVVLERGDKVGGTWWVNTYPGCGCDVPSHLYSFSFAPNPEWTRTYSKQPEIEAYLQRVADELRRLAALRLGTTVTGAAWDDDARRWTIETSRGALRARVLDLRRRARSAIPSGPTSRGSSASRATCFHSAQWDHDYDVTGKRIAAIGTGASAIQFVPAIAPEGRAAARLPAHGAVGHAPLRPADHALRAPPVPALPAAAAAAARRHLRGRASCSCWASSSSRGS